MSTPDVAADGTPFDDEPDPPVDYDVETGTYRTTFDPSDGSVGETVVTAVARARDCDPLGLPPLYPTVDVDAVDSLLAPAPVGTGRPDVSIVFEYAGHAVAIHGHGAIEVRPSG